MRVCGRHLLNLAALVFITIPIATMAWQAPPVRFTKPRPYNWSGGYAVAAADLNGDGHLDLVVINQDCSRCPSQAGVLLGKGDGTFKPVIKYPTGGTYPTSVAVADLNRDSKPDIVVMNDGVSPVAGVLLGKGDGSFQPPVTYGSGGYNGMESGLAVGDLNGDGYPDLAVASGLCDYWSWEELDGCVNVLYNDRHGMFGPPWELNSGYGWTLAVAIAADGSLISTTSCLDPACDWNVGTVCFYDCSESGGTGPVALATGDLNGDGYVDVVVGNVGDIRNVGVLLGTGGYQLQPVVTYGGNTWDVAVGDMNGDGKPDVVINGTGVLLGNGDGTLQPAVTFDWVGDNFVLGDVNGDGKLDVIGTEGTLLNISGFSTTTLITSSLNPSFVNQSVTFTATVSSSHGLIPDGELVKFYSGSKLLASVPIVGGTATYTTSTLTAETHVMKAKYAGDTTFAPSAGGVKQLVQ